MAECDQMQYRKPSPQLAETVRALFASARFLESNGKWRFPGGKKGGPSTTEVHGVFTGLHASLSRWSGQERPADGPDFQLNFTNRLIAIFSGDRQNARGDPDRSDDFDAVLLFWREEPVIQDRVKSVLETLKEYRGALIGTQKKIGLGKTRERLRSLSQLGVLQMGPWDSAPLSTKDFALDEATFSERARAYLRGAEPTFPVAHHAAVDRQAEVRRICNLIRDGAGTIQVCAPIAEGVTTTLMQTAFALVAAQPDCPVFWCARDLFENEPRVLAARHVVIIDDIQDADDVPAWLRTYNTRSPQSVMILGCRQLASRRIARSISSKVFRVRLNTVKPEYAQRYVSRILRCGAADDPTQNLVELFVDALSHHDAGLFPAMYSATRGELLENRYSRLVQSMENTDPRLDALANLIFCDALRTSTRDQIKVPTVPILEAMSDQIEPRSAAHLVRNEIAKLVDSFEGEVRIRSQGLLEVRHPSITHLLYRWIFGSAQLTFQGERRRSQWDFYKRLGVALINLRGPLGLSEILALVADGTNTARYRQQKRYQGEITSACQLLIEVLDTLGSELDLAGIDLARAQIARADLQLQLRERSTDVDLKNELKISALNSLSNAAEAGGQDLGLLLQVAHTLEQCLSQLKSRYLEVRSEIGIRCLCTLQTWLLATAIFLSLTLQSEAT